MLYKFSIINKERFSHFDENDTRRCIRTITVGSEGHSQLDKQDIRNWIKRSFTVSTGVLHPVNQSGYIKARSFTAE